jgi:hypothetical protein
METQCFEEMCKATVYTAKDVRCIAGLKETHSSWESFVGLIFLFTTMFRPTLEAHLASYPVGSGGSFSELKWPGTRAEHLPASNAKIKNVWSYTSTPPYIFMAWCLVQHIFMAWYLVEHRNNSKND